MRQKPGKCATLEAKQRCLKNEGLGTWDSAAEWLKKMGTEDSQLDLIFMKVIADLY